MAGGKIEALITLDSTNNTFYIRSGSDSDAVQATVTAGTYYMGESFLETGTLCRALFNALNVAGSTCSTSIYCTGVSVSSSTHKMTIGMSNTWNFDTYTSGDADNDFLKIIGCHASLNGPIGYSGSSFAMDTPVAYCYWNDDGSDSMLDAVMRQDLESNRANVVITESRSGHKIFHDLKAAGINQKLLAFHMVPSDRMFGSPYGMGFHGLAQNLGFESGGNGSATSWTVYSQATDTAWFPSMGTNSGRITSGWPAFSTATSQTGSWHWEFGDKTMTQTRGAGAIAGDHSGIYQYIDCSYCSGLEIDYSFHDPDKAFKLIFKIGTTEIYSVTSDTNHYQFERAGCLIPLGSQTGYVQLKIQCEQVTAGNKTTPACSIDKIVMRPRTMQTIVPNESLEALWLYLKGGRRFRYWMNTSNRGQFMEYTLAADSCNRFAPSRVSPVLDRWNVEWNLDEYVS